MSTLGQPYPEPAWKQEVARRIAAHKHRKGGSSPEEPAQAHNFGSSLAAQAASRVAARFANAPSYTEMQAEEARLAVRAAEIATKVALEAQAAAEEALAELHAAATEQKRGPAVVESIASARIEAVEEIAVTVPEPEIVSVPEAVQEVPMAEIAEPVVAAPVQMGPAPEPVITQHVVDGRSFGIRWESDAAVRVLQPRPAPTPEPFGIDREDWWTPAEVSATLRNEPIAIESDAGTANLIAFPREIIATRKMRPRLAEPVTAAATERQLSIFEVDPGAVSTEPEPVADPWSTQEWTQAGWNAPAVSDSAKWHADQVAGPKWSGMELDAHPLAAERSEPEPARARQEIHLATLGYRLMAMAVDGCLILAGFFAVAIMLSSSVQPLSPRAAEVFAVLGLAVAGLAYNGLFLGLGISTPGMRYAGIALSTFDDEVPTRAQLRRRLGAMVLSLAPVALGLVWSVFDEDHLSWHDRFSETYLRKR